MAKLIQGAKVKYKFDGKTRTGHIHAIRKVDVAGGTKVLSYVVDTGEDIRVDEAINAKGKVIETTRQPVTVDIQPDAIEAVD